jgi:nucleoid DNA-binding protein
MNKLELAIAIAKDTGLNKTMAYRALTAFAHQLEAEGVAQRAVVWDGFGTFWPRSVQGQRAGRNFDGTAYSYDNWKLVPKPVQLDEAGFVLSAALLAQINPGLMAMLLQSYKAQVLRTLRRGGGVYSQGSGSFRVGKFKARVFHRDDGSVSTRRPARLVVVYRSGEHGPHQKFVGLPGLIKG